MTLPTNAADARVFDLVVVGSGMAGLLSAYETLRRRSSARVLIMDAGLALDDRQRYGTGEWGGYGGAGLFLGGRLYLAPTGLPVLPPTSLPEGLHQVVAGAAYEQRAYAVSDLFSSLGAQAPIRPRPDERLATAIAQARAVGVDYVTTYPARFLSIEERQAVLRNLLAALERQGATFAFRTQATTVAREDDDYVVTLVDVDEQQAEPQWVRARALVLAPGRYGAEWLVRTMSKLGARTVLLPYAFGVRLEVSAAAYSALTSINPDPRLQFVLPNDALVKTYATCPGGLVLDIARYGKLVATGVPLALDQRRPSTTFAVLVQPGIDGAAHDWRGGDAAAKLLNERSPDALIVQRLADIRARCPTNAEAIAQNSIHPTYEKARPGMLYDAYPAAYWDACNELLARIERLAPGTDSGDVLAYGPAEEQFWQFPTDDHLQTTVPGLFVAGDGAGQSQGIIQAGVAGVLAGEGVAMYLRR